MRLSRSITRPPMPEPRFTPADVTIVRESAAFWRTQHDPLAAEASDLDDLANRIQQWLDSLEGKDG